MTRDNVVAFFISSFVYSRGSIQLQKTFLEWMRIKHKVPYKKIIRNLLKSGGVLNLPHEEQCLLLNNYYKYKNHHHREDYGSKDDEEYILDMINSFLARVLLHEPYLSLKQLKRITSAQEFIQKTEDYFTKRTEKS